MRAKSTPGLLLLAGMFLLVGASCDDEANTTQVVLSFPGESEISCAATETSEVSSSAVQELIARDSIADNGIASLTVGAKLGDVHDPPETVLIENCYAADGGVATVRSFSVAGVDDLQLLFIDETLVRVDVTGPSIASINGNHRVGDNIEDVEARYKQRIAAEEYDGRLQASCSTTELAASARPDYRLVFEHQDGIVTRISGQPAAFVSATESCGFLEGETARPETPETTPDQLGAEDDLNVTTFVPDIVANSALSGRNPSTDDLSEELSLLWWAAGQKSMLVTGISIIDSVTSCLYGQEALAVGVYGDTASIVVAFEQAEVDGSDLADCVLTDILIDNLCPMCMIQLPAGGGYVANVDGRQFVVAYATLAGHDHASAMCADLPSCPQAVIQPYVIDVGEPLSIIED